MKRSLVVICLSAVFALLANAVNVTVDAPHRVEQNSSFQIVFFVNGATSSNCDIEFPKQLGWASWLYGPTSSYMNTSSISFSTGSKAKVSSSSGYTFTYTYRAKKKGKYTIPAAAVVCEGKTYHSAPRSIEVVDADDEEDPFASLHRQSQLPGADPFNQTYGQKVTENDAFVRVEMSKPVVFEQEAVVGSVKLYSKYPWQVRCTKLPQFDGFLIEEIPIDRNNIKPEVTTLHGEKYYCFEMGRYILYPQQSGKLTVTPGEYEIKVQQYDVYSAGGYISSLPVNTTMSVKSNTATVEITPLPEPRPANFSGAVGNFNVTSTLSPNKLKTYSPAIYSVIVSGTGNLKSIQAPQVTFPKEFDSYDPLTNIGSANANGNDVSGEVKFDYRVIPQFEGKYTIPEIKFVYFNTSSRKYETIAVPLRTVDVVKGAGKPSSHYQLRNKDIEDISRDIEIPSRTQSHFISTWWYWLIFLAGITLLLSFIPLYRRWVRDHADVRLMRTRRASKVARRRLKSANAAISKGDSNAFYAEVLNAFWGYLSDKLDLPRSSLNKENVTSEMEKYGFSEQQRNSTIELLDRCEFAQYAPELASTDLKEVYNNAAALMDELETVRKRKSDSSSATAKVMTLIIAMFLSLPLLNAGATERFDSLVSVAAKSYDKHDYQQAMKHYEIILHDYGANAELYYNMANTAYRLKDRAYAILYYERALKIDPSFSPARRNLQFVREKTQVDAANSLSGGSWFDVLIGRLSTDDWAVVAVVTFIMSLICIVLLVVLDGRRGKLISFYSAILLVLIMLFSIVSAFRMNVIQSSHKHAIVVTANAHGFTSPHVSGNMEDDKEAIMLTDGVKVEIVDRLNEKKSEETGKTTSWYKVKTAEGKKVWLEAKDIVII